MGTRKAEHNFGEFKLACVSPSEEPALDAEAPRLNATADLYECILSFMAEHEKELEGKQIPSGEVFACFRAWLLRRAPPDAKILKGRKGSSLLCFVELLRARFGIQEEGDGVRPPVLCFPETDRFAAFERDRRSVSTSTTERIFNRLMGWYCRLMLMPSSP